MSAKNWTRQVIAFVAAGIIVFTAVDMFIVWRNQSADRVMKTGHGQVLYQGNDYAIGTVARGDVQHATVLRLSPDGGWSLEGSGPWLNPTATAPYGQFAVVRNLSTGPVNSYWLCAVEGNHRGVTSIELYNAKTHNVEEDYSFHHGGIIEPVIIHPGTELRLLRGQTVVLTLPILESQIP